MKYEINLTHGIDDKSTWTVGYYDNKNRWVGLRDFTIWPDAHDFAHGLQVLADRQDANREEGRARHAKPIAVPRVVQVIEYHEGLLYSSLVVLDDRGRLWSIANSLQKEWQRVALPPLPNEED